MSNLKRWFQTKYNTIMSRLDQIIQTVSANGMREITIERAKQIAIEYAKECSQASLEKASENIDYEYTYAYSSERNMGDIIEKSITNETNIILL